MSIHQSSSPPFWPSRRLWLKFFIAVSYIPFVVNLLLISFVGALFSPFYLVLLLLALTGGPVLLGLLLARSWRGVVAGLVTMAVIPVIWYVAGTANDASSVIDDVLQLGIAAASAAVLLELVSRDVREPQEQIGLGVGVLVGFLLLFAYKALVASFHYAGAEKNQLLLISWSAPIVLIWLSAFFFPEWISRKVSWGGIIVWIALVAAVLGLSFTLMK